MRAEQTTARRRRAVPWVFLGLWIAVIALAGPFASKLADAQQDRVVDYLPASADSTQVAKIQDRLPGGEATELVLVYHRDGGLTAADRKAAAAQIDEIGHRQAGRRPARRTVQGRHHPDVPGGQHRARPGREGQGRTRRRRARSRPRQGRVERRRRRPGALATDAGKVYDSLGGPLLYTTAGVVALLLILIYRSPFLWLVPLAVAGIADYLAMGVAYGLHEGFGTSVTGQSSGVMTILVFGAGTDYALLIVSRYREELRRIERPYDAMAAALKGCGPAVLASSGTVAAAAVPARRRPQQQPRHGPVGHGRGAVRARRDADAAARGPRPPRPARVLAARARLRQRAQAAPQSLLRDGSSAGAQAPHRARGRRRAARRARPGGAEPAGRPEAGGLLHQDARLRHRDGDPRRGLPRTRHPAHDVITPADRATAALAAIKGTRVWTAPRGAVPRRAGRRSRGSRCPRPSRPARPRRSRPCGRTRRLVRRRGQRPAARPEGHQRPGPADHRASSSWPCC